MPGLFQETLAMLLNDLEPHSEKMFPFIILLQSYKDKQKGSIWC